MSKRKILAGSTSVMLPVFIQDTTSTIGAGLGSLVFNTAGLAAKYRREGQSTWTAITLVTATLGTYASGGFVSDGGPVTGTYEFHPPDAALASGAKWVEIVLYGATNMLAVRIEIELDAVNYQDGVRLGLAALPNVASGSAGSLLTSGTSTSQLNVSGGKAPATLASTDVTGNLAADLQTIKTQTVTCAAGVTIGAFVGNATHAIAVDSSGNVTFNNTSIATVTNLTNSPTSGDLTAAMKTSVENAVWNAPTASHTTAGTYGLLIATDLDAAVSSRMATYTQPTGFLAASFPTTVASPTNISAGTITTVSGDVEGKVLGGGASALTGTGVRAVDASGAALATAANQTTIITDVGLCQQAGAPVTLPTIPANWIDAAGIAAGALNGKGDWLLATSYGTTSFTESLPAVGAAMTEAQLLYEIRSLLAADSVSSSTLSTDTVAGTAKATYTLTLDGSGNPTGIARAT